MIIIDINTIPEIHEGGMKLHVGELLQKFKEADVWLYDSTKGETPRVSDEEVAVVDVNSKEGVAWLKEHDYSTKSLTDD